MSIAIVAAWCVLLVLGAMSLWMRRRQRKGNPFTTRSTAIVDFPKRAVMPNASSMLVFVSEDGSVRELTEDDKEYVDAEFSPLDGNRPYVKSSYSDRNVSGRLRGHLPRAKVPPGVAIVAAPEQEASQPQTPQAVAKSLSEPVGKHGRS